MGVRTTNNSMSFTSSSARTFARTMLFLAVFATALVLVLPAGAKIAWAEEFGGDVPNYDEQPADTWSWMSSDGKWFGWKTDFDVVLNKADEQKVSGDEKIPESFSAQVWKVGSGGSYVISTQTLSVTTIAGEAFYGNTAITGIEIPSTVERIGIGAFRYCTNLETVVFDSEELPYIPAECFKQCFKLSSITIPGSVLNIGSSAFANCTNLTTATMEDPSSLTTIGSSAFEFCISLKSITIPKKVHSILKRAFFHCYALEHVFFDYADESMLDFIDDEAFYECKALKEIELPFRYNWNGQSSSGDSGRSEIGDNVFSFCESLEKVGFRNWPRVQGNHPEVYDNFDHCPNLKFVIIKYDIMSDFAHGYNLGLPDNATYMLVKLTSNKKNLEICKIFTDSNFGRNTTAGSVDLVIPASFITYDFVSIEAGATCESYLNLNFRDPQKGLKSVTFEEGSKIEHIGYGAFAECNYLETITIPASVKSIGDAPKNSSDPSHQVGYTFYACQALSTVFFETTQLTTIESGLFFGCGSLCSTKTDDSTEFALPNGIKQIKDLAFHQCQDMTKVWLPDTVTQIDETAFRECKYTTEMRMPDSNAPMVLGTNGFWTNMGNTSNTKFRVTCGSYFEDQVLLKTDAIKNKAVYDAVDITLSEEDQAVYNQDNTTVKIYTKASTYTYNARQQAPTIDDENSKRWWHTMVFGVDYRIDWGTSQCTDAGSAYVTIMGVDNGTDKTKFTGTRQIPFSIAKASLAGKLEYESGPTVPGGDCYYDNLQWKPEATFSYPGLSGEGTDYTLKDTDVTISYGPNADAGEKAGSITVSAKSPGNFQDSDTLYFDIRPRDLSREATVAPIPDQYYTGSELTPKPTVTVKNRNDADLPLAFGENKDYTLTYSNNVNVGTNTATVTIEATSHGNVTESTSATFSIKTLDLSDDDIDIEDIDNQEYTGSEITPELEVYSPDGYLLEQGKAYSVEWSNNVHASTATSKAKATLKGIEPHSTGEVSVEFKIVPKRVTVTPDALSKTYGDADPDLTATVPGLVTGDSVEFTLSREEGEDASTYTITSSGEKNQGDYSVSFGTGIFTINPANLNGTATVNAQSCEYDGQEQKPAPTVTWQAPVASEAITLSEGTDYTITSYTNNIHFGTASVTVEGKGNFTGTATGTFSITRRPATVTADNLGKVYGAKDPLLTASIDNLVEDDSLEYSVSRVKGENVGNYVATPSGAATQGDYTVSYASGTFTIDQADIADAVIAPIAAQTYAGERLEPALSISYAGEAFSVDLAAGADYEAAYTSNLNVGTANVKVTGAGNFTGENSATFEIARKPITVTADDYTIAFGDLDPILTAKTSGVVDEFEPLYDFSREEGDPPGEYVIWVAGDELQGNYQVTYVPGTLTIKQRNISDAVVVVADIPTYTYTGQDIKPVPSLVFAGKAFTFNMVADRDYEVSYSANRDAGTAAVVLKGAGSFTGSRTVEFEIAPKSATVSANDATKTYGELDPSLTASVEGIVDDFRPKYTFSREEGEDADDYVIWVSGGELQGNYQVSYVPGTLTISPADIADATVEPVAAQVYAGKRLEPALSISYAGKAFSVDLAAGADYEATYADNLNVGTATVAVKGTGNFTGENSAAFEITPASMSEIVVAVADVTYDGTAQEPEPTVTWNEMLLIEGTDYEIASYTDNVHAGTAKVVVRSKGNFAGETTGTFEIAKRPLTVTAASATREYDGTALTAGGFDAEGMAADDKVASAQVKGSQIDVGSSANVASNAKVVNADGQDVTADYAITYVEGTLTIEPAELGEDGHFTTDPIADVAYNGLPREPKPVVRSVASNAVLVEGVDYELSYRDNIEVGTATVVIDGIGNYAGTLETTFQIVMPAAAYILVRGPEGIVKLGGDTVVEFEFKRTTADETTLDHLVGVLVDGKQIASSDYTTRRGSAIIAPTLAFLKSLQPGTHTLTASFDDGFAVAAFTIAEPDNPDNPDNPDDPNDPNNPDNPDNPVNPVNPDNNIPSTGDGMLPFALLLVAIAAGAVALAAKRNMRA